MNQCPKCGGTSGVFFKEWQQWYSMYTWQGEPIDSEQSTYSRGGKMLYCLDCEKPIAHATTFFRDKPI